MDIFDQWNKKKKNTNNGKRRYFHEREIVLAELGYNIGVEQNGKGEKFLRPVVILKKLNNAMAIVVPTTTQIKRRWYEFPLFFGGRSSVALITQIKLIDAKRIFRKIDQVPQSDFEALKKQVIKMFN